MTIDGILEWVLGRSNKQLGYIILMATCVVIFVVGFILGWVLK